MTQGFTRALAPRLLFDDDDDDDEDYEGIKNMHLTIRLICKYGI